MIFFSKKLKINALWFKNCITDATQGRSFNFGIFQGSHKEVLADLVLQHLIASTSFLAPRLPAHLSIQVQFSELA